MIYCQAKSGRSPIVQRTIYFTVPLRSSRDRLLFVLEALGIACKPRIVSSVCNRLCFISHPRWRHRCGSGPNEIRTYSYWGLVRRTCGLCYAVRGDRSHMPSSRNGRPDHCFDLHRSRFDRCFVSCSSCVWGLPRTARVLGARRPDRCTWR